MKRLVVMLLTIMVVAGFVTPVHAQAENSILAGYSESRAKAVEPDNTYLVTVKSSDYSLQAYLKFTVPKTKKYKFIFSNLAKQGERSEESDAYGYAYFYKFKDDQQHIPIQLKIGKGKTKDTLYLASEYHVEHSDLNSKLKYEEKFLPKRTGTVKLKKGETIYLCLFTSCWGDLTLKIK